MTSFDWAARDRNVEGVSGSPTGGVVLLRWGPNLETALGSTIPWTGARYPSLLITGISFDASTSIVVGARRARIELTQPFGSGYTDFSAQQAQGAAQSRTYEFAPGIALSTPLAGGIIREVIPNGLILHPGGELSGDGVLRVSLNNIQLGDSMSTVRVRGILLLDG